jgi:hypothetical protein
MTPPKSALWGGLFVGVLAAVQLMALWHVFLNTDNKVTQTVFIGMVPVLLTFVAIGFVLPLLKSFKVPGGLEAEVHPATSQAPSGPKPALGLGASVSSSLGTR